MLGAVITTGTLVAAVPGTAHAATLPPNLQKFQHCPVSNPKVVLCVFGSMTGSFTIKSTTLTTPKPAKLSIGLVQGSKGLFAVSPTDGTSALQSPAIPVSILGLPGLPSPLSVTAKPVLKGTPKVNFVNLLNGTGVAVTVSLFVKLNNVLLGSGCTIGTRQDPITINLTAGTTSPPPPNMPITGNKGTLTDNPKTGIITDAGVVLVDNAFAVPGANGCGPLGLLDPALNLIEGLPSAAGNNTGVFSGTSYIVPAAIIRTDLG